VAKGRPASAPKTSSQTRGALEARPQLPSGAIEVWAYDFVNDACTDGQQIKCLTIIDEYTRECLAIDVVGSLRSNRVVEVLARLVSERGAPRHLRSDNVPGSFPKRFCAE
jgi:putative transposase